MNSQIFKNIFFISFQFFFFLINLLITMLRTAVCLAAIPRAPMNMTGGNRFKRLDNLPKPIGGTHEKPQEYLTVDAMKTRSLKRFRRREREHYSAQVHL